jgi:NAD-dependent SIR2 family protein deacetylase
VTKSDEVRATMGIGETVVLEVNGARATLTFPQAWEMAELLQANIRLANGPRGMSRLCPYCGAAGVRTTLAGFHEALPDRNRCTCAVCAAQWLRCDEDKVRAEQERRR